MKTLSQIAYAILLLQLVACVSASDHETLLKNHERSENQVKEQQVKIDELETLVAELERKLGMASANKKSMSQSIMAMKEALQEASARKKETEKRMAEYRQLIRQFSSLTKAGALSIKIVDGRMVVALESDVLFKSGSSKLSKKGNATIAKVAGVLAGIDGKKFQIEGHTDDVPIKNSARFKSNWELASARALNVLKTMTESGLPEDRVSAASFADTRPVADNKKKKGRAANRRIEIVVIPDLSQLPGYDELERISNEKSS